MSIKTRLACWLLGHDWRSLHLFMTYTPGSDKVAFITPRNLIQDEFIQDDAALGACSRCGHIFMRWLRFDGVAQ